MWCLMMPLATNLVHSQPFGRSTPATGFAVLAWNGKRSRRSQLELLRIVVPQSDMSHLRDECQQIPKHPSTSYIYPLPIVKVSFCPRRSSTWRIISSWHVWFSLSLLTLGDTRAHTHTNAWKNIANTWRNSEWGVSHVSMQMCLAQVPKRSCISTLNGRIVWAWVPPTVAQPIVWFNLTWK